jgi:hypothetical protein
VTRFGLPPIDLEDSGEADNAVLSARKSVTGQRSVPALKLTNEAEGTEAPLSTTDLLSSIKIRHAPNSISDLPSFHRSVKLDSIPTLELIAGEDNDDRNSSIPQSSNETV